MEFKGKIIKVFEARGGVSKSTGKEWKSQDYLIQETSGEYPKKMVFNVFGDKIAELHITEGEELTVHFDIDAREFNGRFFNDVRAWKVERDANAQPTNQPDGGAQPYVPSGYDAYGAAQQAQTQPQQNQSSEDGLPF